MKWNVASKLGAGFGLVLLIFVVIAAVSYRSVTGAGGGRVDP